MAKKQRKLMVPSEPIVSMGNGNIWLRLRAPQPRAWLVNKTVPSDHPAADIAKISLGTEALVEKGESPVDSTVNPTASEASTVNTTATVTMLADRPGNISLSVNAPTQQLLVVGESYHTGWHAWVDEQKAAILRADGDFMGLVVGPGDHEIRLKFQPESLHYGRLASSFGLSLMVVMLLATAWPAGRRRSSHC
jgi:hypothetical protein